MSKKVVGLIVATVIVVVLLLAVVIGGLRLRKDNNSASGNVQRVQSTQTQTSQNSSQPSSASGNYSSSSNFQSDTGTNQVATNSSSSTSSNSQTDAITNSQNNQQLVDKVIKQSNKVGDSNSQPENQSLTITPSNAELKPDVYELNGVVKDMYLVTDSNQIQSYYKAIIEVPLGTQTVDFSYITTSSSLSILNRGTPVTVSYQLTSDNTVVIKGLSLKK